MPSEKNIFEILILNPIYLIKFVEFYFLKYYILLFYII